MKIIHTADIHLGSKIESKLKSISQERQNEVLNTFIRLVDYAKENDVKMILLAGDVFDSNTPKKKDHDNFYKLIENNPQIDFIYLRGNHDLQENYADKFPNLKTFDSNWKSYEYEDIRVTGIEMNEENYKSLYHTLNLTNDKTNIVLLHGEVSPSFGLNKVNISKLKGKNINYLALGHIHKFGEGIIDESGIYVNPGCLEGRGFDETGRKGFVLLNTDSMEYASIRFSKREIERIEIDITGAKSLVDILDIVKEKLQTKPENIIEVVLVGELDFDIEFDIEDIISNFKNDYYFFTAKDKTIKKIDIKLYQNDKSFKGEFIRKVYNDEKLSEEEKSEIIKLGLNALQLGGAKL